MELPEPDVFVAPTPRGQCPPDGLMGVEPGDVVPDLELLDCDGVAHTFHDLCDAEAAWIFTFSGS